MFAWLRARFGHPREHGFLDGAWRVTSYVTTAGHKQPLEGASPEIAIEGSRLSGTTGLNRIGGQFDGTFPLAPFAVTRMAGPPELMEQENEILGLLQTADGYQVEDETLILERSSEAVIVLKRTGTLPT